MMYCIVVQMFVEVFVADAHYYELNCLHMYCTVCMQLYKLYE